MLARFLSHLSGDEEKALSRLSIDAFLSHLSGDEGFIMLATPPVIFLSHLSGDEERKGIFC